VKCRKRDAAAARKTTTLSEKGRRNEKKPWQYSLAEAAKCSVSQKRGKIPKKMELRSDGIWELNIRNIMRNSHGSSMSFRHDKAK